MGDKGDCCHRMQAMQAKPIFPCLASAGEAGKVWAAAPSSFVIQAGTGRAISRFSLPSTAYAYLVYAYAAEGSYATLRTLRYRDKCHVSWCQRQLECGQQHLP